MSQSTVSIINLEKFKNTVLFSITVKRWGNRAQVKNLKALEEYLSLRNAPDDATAPESAGPTVSLADDRVKSNKMLVKSKNLDALFRKLTEIKKYCEERSMPSYFRKGMFVVKTDQVKVLEDYLRGAIEAVNQTELVAFLEGYEADIEAARTTSVKKGGLGPLFNEKDYPSTDEMRKCFGLDWYWLALSVPDNIPDEMKAEAGEKFSRRLMSAADDIETALRMQFKELLTHAEERLTVAPGEKQKVFRESLIGNLVQFCNTFDSKNVFGDDRLAGIIAEARVALGATDTKKLREFASVRDVAKTQFAAMREKIDAMIEEKKGRAFDLSDD